LHKNEGLRETERPHRLKPDLPLLIANQHHRDVLALLDINFCLDALFVVDDIGGDSEAGSDIILDKLSEVIGFHDF